MNRIYKYGNTNLKNDFRNYHEAIDVSVKLLEDELDKLRKNGESKPLFINFFISAMDDADFFQMKSLILEDYNKVFQDISVCVLGMAPADGSLMTIEICLTDASAQVEYKQWSKNIHYVVVNENGEKCVMAFGLGMDVDNCYGHSDTVLPSVTIQSESAFSIMESILAAEEMTFDHVVRQWNYVPRLTQQTEIDGKIYQNYQLFNEIRQKYYSYYKKNAGYPAATGIGVNYGAMTISFIAYSFPEKTPAYELTNPHQIDAYKYGQNVLVGESLLESQKKTPLFERGKMLLERDKKVFYISGTASILGQETVYIGDVEKQTEVTIQNIDSLMTQEALKNTSIDISGKKEIVYLRAYLKNASDLDKVRTVCEKRYGSDVCIHYVQTDVCRDNLLVEIEGEFILR